MFQTFLGDLKKAHKIYAFNIVSSDKENAVTFDISVQIHRDRTPKKLKKRLEKQIAEIIYIIAHELKIENVRFFEPNLILSSWYLLWLEKNNKDFLKYQLGL